MWYILAAVFGVYYHTLLVLILPCGYLPKSLLLPVQYIILRNFNTLSEIIMFTIVKEKLSNFFKGFTLIELLSVLFLIGLAFVAPKVVFCIVTCYFVIKLFCKFLSLGKNKEV